MLEIKEMEKNFNEVYSEFEEAKRTNRFHEASDMYAYLTGLVTGMRIILDCNSTNYTEEDGRIVDIALTKLNQVSNVN